MRVAMMELQPWAMLANRELGVNVALSEVWAKGGEGGLALADEVVALCENGDEAGRSVMATTQGRLYTFVMFSTCCSRFGRPASSAEGAPGPHRGGLHL